MLVEIPQFSSRRTLFPYHIYVPIYIAQVYVHAFVIQSSISARFAALA